MNEKNASVPLGVNWAGNHAYEAAVLHKPATTAELQALIADSDKVKVLGTRHCFNDIADFPGGALISLEHFDGIEIDRSSRAVIVGGGVRYGELGEYLQREGWALHNLASLPHISVAGACATATHGSGVKNGNLATAVSALEVVLGNGEIVTLSRERDGDMSPSAPIMGDLFLGAVVGLGGVGAVTKLTLDIEPTFDVRQDVYENLLFAEIENHFDEVMSSAYSVSLFTDWRGERFSQVWLKNRIPSLPSSHLQKSGNANPSRLGSHFFGASAATGPMHPLAGNDPSNCTEQMGVPGPWNERLAHFKFGFQPSNGDELQSEYFVPLANAVDALRALWPLGDKIRDLLWVTEIRAVAADDLWMSPCYRQASVGIHFTWKKNWPEVGKLLPVIEDALAPFDARPHWGKLFTMSPSRLQSLYEKLGDFRELVGQYDPAGKFRNPYLDQYVFG